MTSSFNVYSTGILYGLGRILVITASQYEPNEKDLTAETYVFSLDMGPEGGRYKGRRIFYKHDPEIQAALNINHEFMEDQAKQAAKTIISVTQHNEFLRTNDQNYMGRPVELFVCDKVELVSLKELDGYAARLEYIVKDTKSEALRQYIKMILRMPHFEVEEFE